MCKRLKDVSYFNEEFLKILLETLNISAEEEIDRYTIAHKPYVSDEMYINEYGDISGAMAGAERIGENQ